MSPSRCSTPSTALGLSGREVDAAIEAAISRGRARGVPLVWLTGPATRPANLGTSLEAHGFVRGDEMLGMAVDLSLLASELPPLPGLAVTEADDEASLHTWCVTMSAAFEYPPFVRRLLRALAARALACRALLGGPLPRLAGR